MQLLKKSPSHPSLPKRPTSTFYSGLSGPGPLQGLQSARQGLTDQSTHYSPLCLTLYNKAQNGPEGVIRLRISWVLLQNSLSHMGWVVWKGSEHNIAGSQTNCKSSKFSLEIINGSHFSGMFHLTKRQTPYLQGPNEEAPCGCIPELHLSMSGRLPPAQ